MAVSLNKKQKQAMAGFVSVVGVLLVCLGIKIATVIIFPAEEAAKDTTTDQTAQESLSEEVANQKRSSENDSDFEVAQDIEGAPVSITEAQSALCDTLWQNPDNEATMIFYNFKFIEAKGKKTHTQKYTIAGVSVGKKSEMILEVIASDYPSGENAYTTKIIIAKANKKGSFLMLTCNDFAFSEAYYDSYDTDVSIKALKPDITGSSSADIKISQKAGE